MLKIDEKFTNFNAADSNYPNGSYKNDTIAGDKTGTAVDAASFNDALGFSEALMAEAGMEPSGNPDTATSSDRLDAMKAVFVEQDNTGTAAAYDVTESTTDTSAGNNGQKRLLKAGDAGVLETGNQGGGFDFDAESVTRIVAFSGGGAAANGKPFDAWGANITFTNDSFPDIKQQLFIGNSGSAGSSDMRALFRTMPNNGVYNDWVEMLSTNRAGSIDPETSTADTTSFNHTSTGAVHSMRSAGVEVGSITVTGSATSYNTSSDYRLKEDWRAIENASDRLLSLNPVNFKWKSSEDRADGFLAHELQAVIPEAVTGEKDEVELFISTDEEGNKIETEFPKHQAIDQSKVVPLLTAALQEALKRIEALENA